MFKLLKLSFQCIFYKNLFVFQNIMYYFCKRIQKTLKKYQLICVDWIKVTL